MHPSDPTFVNVHKVQLVINMLQGPGNLHDREAFPFIHGVLFIKMTGKKSLLFIGYIYSRDAVIDRPGFETVVCLLSASDVVFVGGSECGR